MKISIITVCYNSEKTIAKTIESVISQSYKNIEYIIIDGLSNDKTLDIIEKYKSEIDIVISERDFGIYDAINKGINCATGDVIGILNSDDYFSTSEVLANINNIYNTNPGLDILYSDVIFFDDEKKKVTRYYSSKYFKPFMFRFGFQPAHPTFYVKKYVFERLGNYNKSFEIAADFDLMLRFLYFKQLKVLYIDDVWVIMKKGGASTSGLKSALKLNEEILISCKDNNIYSNLFFIYLKYCFKWVGFVRVKFLRKIKLKNIMQIM